MRALLIIGILLASAAMALATPGAGTPTALQTAVTAPAAGTLFDVRAPASTSTHAPAALRRGGFYCPPPSFDYAVNASTAVASEVADDLPDSLTGRTIGEVTLYITEWGSSEWVEPVGVVISFYDGECPPPLEAAVVCSFAWSGLATNLVHMNPPVKIVSVARAALPTPVTIATGMSLGAYVVTDWPMQPYAGLTLTQPDDLHGCGELYWDDATHGAPRWTPLSTVTGIAADLAYCLAEEGTGLQNEMSWGRMKSLFR
jgi:hypothetical protein